MSTPPDRTPLIHIDVNARKPFRAWFLGRRRGEATMALYSAGQEMEEPLGEPVSECGLTIIETSQIFGIAQSVVEAAYKRNNPSRTRIGRADPYGIWRASPADVAAVFSLQRLDPTEPVAVQRARSKAELLRAKIEGGRAR
jgi:hypothetical protein